MKTILLRLIACSLLLAFSAIGSLAQVSAGTIKVLGLSGTVARISADGSSLPLSNGDVLTESDTVVTAADSGAVLVFMNGSSVKVGAGTRLAIEEFKMDPLMDTIEVATLKAEPSVSQTKLNLVYGEMVGDVKKLNKSSSYSIKTPAGAAGIRGTTFRLVFIPAADGKTFTFTLSTADGLVSFTNSTTTAPVDVGAGNEVTVAGDMNTATGAISNVQIQTQGISAGATQAITAAIAEVMQQAQTRFTTSEQTAPDSTVKTLAPATESQPILDTASPSDE